MVSLCLWVVGREVNASQRSALGTTVGEVRVVRQGSGVTGGRPNMDFAPCMLICKCFHDKFDICMRACVRAHNAGIRARVINSTRSSRILQHITSMKFRICCHDVLSCAVYFIRKIGIYKHSKSTESALLMITFLPAQQGGSLR